MPRSILLATRLLILLAWAAPLSSASLAQEAYKGKIAERNAARSPWSHQIDVRISQEIPTIAGHKLELIFDVTNVFNFVDKKWGWIRPANDTQL